MIDDVEGAITERVRLRHAEWFPDAPAGGEVRVTLMSHRPRSRLYAVAVGPPATPPTVVAKVRRDWPGPSRRPGGRPTLSADPLTAAELTALEYAGLQTAVTAVAGDDRFGVVRPLDHLLEHDTILMERVPATTLRQVLGQVPGQVPGQVLARRRVSLRAEEMDTWRRVGGWVDRFQGAAAGQPPAPARQETREEVVERFGAYGRYLGEQVGQAAARRAQQGAALARDVLPQRLPLALGHGDYAPRNVFLLDDGRVTVFDPLARWRAPAYEDVCRFLVGVQLLGLQLHTHGAALGRRRVEDVERAVLDGFAPRGLPAAEVRCYQLLILLDKWSALVDASAGGGRAARVRAASLRLASRYVLDQADRLLGSGSAPSSLRSSGG